MHSVWNNIVNEEVETAIKIFCMNNFKTVTGRNYSACQNEDASLETYEISNASAYAQRFPSAFPSAPLPWLQWKSSQGTEHFER